MLSTEQKKVLHETMNLCVFTILDYGDEALAFSAMGALVRRAEHICELKQSQRGNSLTCSAEENTAIFGGSLSAIAGGIQVTRQAGEKEAINDFRTPPPYTNLTGAGKAIP